MTDTTFRTFTDRREAEVFAQARRADQTFVRWSERRVNVSNRARPAAAQFRPRFNFTVTFTR